MGVAFRLEASRPCLRGEKVSGMPTDSIELTDKEQGNSMEPNDPNSSIEHFSDPINGGKVVPMAPNIIVAQHCEIPQSSPKYAEPNAKQFYIISGTYLVFTITDSSLRMIVLFQLYRQNFTILQIATIFTFYELVGVFTKFQ